MTCITYELAMRGGAFAHSRQDLVEASLDHAKPLADQEEKEQTSTRKHVLTFSELDRHVAGITLGKLCDDFLKYVQSQSRGVSRSKESSTAYWRDKGAV